MPEPEGFAPELVALVHHIELNKVGWWETALQKLILSVFLLRSDLPTLDTSEVVEALQKQLGIEIPASDASTQLDALSKQGDILHVGGGRFKISEATARQCEREVEEATQLERDVEGRFADQLATYCPYIDSNHAWKLFVDKFLIPVVNELGANTYQILTGTKSPDNLTQINDFLKCFNSEYELELAKFLRNFLNPADALVRRFVLRTMNAFFVVQAGGLSKNTVDRLSTTKTFSATLFFDTNVLFSLLGLHENPADQGSRMLLELVRKLSASVPIKLRVLPPTLDEMTRVIRASQETLANLRISPALVQSAINIGLTGITTRYLQMAAERKGTVSPGDYFEPYLKNLLTILRSRGVELFNQDLSSYGTKQDVINDILERQAFERQRYGASAKSYEQLRHDLVLWHFVKDKRPPRPESPIDAEYWIVTADFRFLGFDAYKHRTITSDVLICMYPAVLVQLLRFWIPLDEEFEKALFSAIRLPAVISHVDAEAERISLRILNALSSFENIGDLPEETATRILLNDALRQRLAVEKEVSKQIELVREALIEENKAAEARLQAERARSVTIQQHSRSLEAQLEERSKRVENLEAELKNQSSRAQEKVEELTQTIQARDQRSSRVRFLAGSGLTLFFIIGIGYLTYRLGGNRTVIVSIIGGLLVFWIAGVRILGTKNSHIKDWQLYKKFARSAVGAIVTVLLGIAANALWAGIEKLASK